MTEYTTPSPLTESTTTHGQGNSPSATKRNWSNLSVLGLLQIVGLLPFVATFMGFAGRIHWTLDLLNHFRFQYLIILSVVCLLLAYLKFRKLATIYLVGVVINLMTVLPLYWPTFAHENPAQPTLKLMHFNVHAGNKNYDGVADYISQSDCQIVLIQELHMRMDERLRKMTDYQMVISEPRYDSFGIGLLVRRDVADQLRIDKPVCTDITEGRAKVPAILAKVIWQDKTINLMSLHTLPPISASYAQARNTQLSEAALWAQKNDGPMIVIGDLNATPWSTGFRRLFTTTNLHNSQQGFGVQASWPADGGPIGKIPIDHCLLTDDFVVTDRHLGFSCGSDHLPLFVTLQFK